MSLPDYLKTEPALPRKNTLFGTAFDISAHNAEVDYKWIQKQLDESSKRKSLHSQYKDPFLKMGAYRLEDAVTDYKRNHNELSEKEENAFYFNKKPVLPGIHRQQDKTLAVDYARSEANDQYNRYYQLKPEDIREMNKMGISPQSRLTTGSFNYDKYLPRTTEKPFEINGQILLKQKNAESINSQVQPTIYLQQYTARKRKGFSPKTEPCNLQLDEQVTEIPDYIKHKFGGNVEELVSKEDVQDLYAHYNAMNEQKPKESKKEINKEAKYDQGKMLRSNITGVEESKKMSTENTQNYTSDEFKKSRNLQEYIPPDQSRRRRDSYTKWMGMNILDQHHRQEWKDYMNRMQAAKNA